MRIKRTLSLLLITCLVLCLASCGSFYDKSAQDGMLDGRTQEEIDELLAQEVPEGMLQVSINGNPVFLNGTEPGNLRIENAPNNPYDMRVVILLTDTEEEVYASGGIKPNQYIESAALSVNLDAGEYAATVKFYAVNEKHEDIGLVTKEITLTVLE